MSVGKIGKLQRKVVYVPPTYNTASVEALKETLVQEIAAVKTALRDPVVLVFGDFNRRDFSTEFALAGDLIPLETGPTRGDVALDLIFTNEKSAIKDSRVLPPLHSDQGAESDHKCVFVEVGFRKERNFNWVVKMRRLRTQAKEAAFAQELSGWDWTGLRESEDVDTLAGELERVVAALTEKHFPLVRLRRRSKADPWITRSIRRLWKKKIRHYKKGGKNAHGWATDRKLQEAISSAKMEYVERLLQEGGNQETRLGHYSSTTDGY